MIALVAISVGATYALTSTTLLNDANPNQISGTLMTGHVDAIVHDEGGNIVAYRQSDNEIVIGGMETLADQLFLECDEVGSGIVCAAASTNNHTNTTSGAFGWMNIGNASNAPSGTDVGLGCPLLRANNGMANCPAGTNANRAACIGVFDEVWNSESVLKGGSSQINVTVISTFDGADCESRDIQEAAMWNNATIAPAGDLFARNTFGSVTLTSTDSLELTWRFTFTDQ